MTRVVYSFFNMQELVDFIMTTLRERSPVGGAGDKHPGLYRDSHMIFIDGHVVKDASNWKPGQQINISNPVPYSRKIESGKFTASVPGHIYEETAQLAASRYGNSASVKFVFMPVRFGDVSAYAEFSKRIRPGRKMSDKARKDWLVRQPAIEVKAR